MARLEEQLFRLFANARFAGAARVEVMTIHAAKGLEFDTVIVPGLQRYLPNYNRELLRWTRVAGPQGGMVLAPVKPDGGDPDPIYRWIELLERRRVARERARLLYVAVTRAKRELHIFGNATAKERDGRLVLDDPRRGSMLRMLWGAVETQFWETEPSAPVPAGYKPAPPQKLRRLPHRMATAAHAARRARARLRRSSTSRTERPVFDWVSQVSRHVGTLVHRELDRVCRPGMQASPETLRPARARLMAELAELGVPPDRCAAACERVMAAMERTLADERGRWLLGIDGGIREAASELALSGVVDGPDPRRRHRPDFPRRGGAALDRRLQDQHARGRRAGRVPGRGSGAVPAAAGALCPPDASLSAGRDRPGGAVFPGAAPVARSACHRLRKCDL